MEKKNDRIIMAVLNFFLNPYGVPDFVKGNNKEGVKHIILTCLTFGVFAIIYGIKGIIEAIRLFKMSDDEYMKEKYGA